MFFQTFFLKLFFVTKIRPKDELADFVSLNVQFSCSLIQIYIYRYIYFRWKIITGRWGYKVKAYFFLSKKYLFGKIGKMTVFRKIFERTKFKKTKHSVSQETTKKMNQHFRPKTKLWQKQIYFSVLSYKPISNFWA